MELPSLSRSLLPILFPLALIFVNTAASVLVPDTQIANFCAFIGSPLAALFTGCILSLLLTGKDWKSKKVLNDWVNDGIKAAACPEVTGMAEPWLSLLRTRALLKRLRKSLPSPRFRRS